MVHCPGSRAWSAGPLLASLAVLITNWACSGNDLLEPSTASLVVTTTTIGEDRDSDGYAFSVDGGPARPVAADTTLVVSHLASGEHTIQLSGVASNCTSTGANPRTVTLAAGDSGSLKFAISCFAVTGRLMVTVITTGGDRDSDGYLLAIDGNAPEGIRSNGQVTIPRLPPGSHALTLSDVAPNCTLAGDNPRDVNVKAGSLVTVRFEVVCAATGLEVTTATTGPDPDSDGYLLTLNGGEPRRLEDNDTLSLQLGLGDYTLAFSDIASNCALTGENPRSIHVALGSVVSMTFTITCKSRVPPPGVLLFWGGLEAPHLYRTAGSKVVDLTPNSDGEKGRWNHDRSRIVFGTVRNDSNEIFVMNADGSAPRRITSGLNPAWSPDGTRIVFQSGSSVSIVNSDGSGLTQLTQGPSDAEPAWSPDGRRIAFTRLSRTACRLLINYDVVCARDLYIMEANGSGLVNLTNLRDGAINVEDPSWSPDGTTIAYARRVFPSGSDVWTMRADGTETKNLTGTTAPAGPRESSPVWSTDGSVIAISRAEGNGPAQLGTIPAAGGAFTLWPGVPDGVRPSSWR